MKRLFLSLCASIAMVCGILLIDRGKLGSRLEDFAIREMGNAATAPIIRLIVAVALIAIGVQILGFLFASDRTPRAMFRRRVFVRAAINVAWLFAVLAGLSGAVVYLEGWELSRWVVAQLFFSGFLAGAVGFGELIQRYKDNPHHLLASSPTAIYVCVNAAAGIGALALVKHFEVFSVGSNKGLYEVLLAGFGAIAFFRTSFFTAKVGDADVGIGPATLLKSLLDSSDMMTDREQAVVRGETIGTVMLNVDFEKAQAALPALCFTLVEGASPEQQHAVGLQVAKLVDDTSITSKAKAGILGAYLVRQVGAQVLAQAVDALGSEITYAVPETATGSADGLPTGQTKQPNLPAAAEAEVYTQSVRGDSNGGALDAAGSDVARQSKSTETPEVPMSASDDSKTNAIKDSKTEV